MSSRIMLVQGHPDNSAPHFCHGLAKAYLEGASEGGHEARLINVADLEFPMLRSRKEFYGALPAALAESAEALEWANHLVVIYPLWLGTMPALLKAWFEQLFRPGIALEEGGEQGWPHALLRQKSCRLIVTMGMPAMAYRWYFRAHSLKSLERNVLKFSGIGPIRESLIGMVDADGQRHHDKWLGKMRELGRQGR